MIMYFRPAPLLLCELDIAGAGKCTHNLCFFLSFKTCKFVKFHLVSSKFGNYTIYKVCLNKNVCAQVVTDVAGDFLD